MIEPMEKMPPEDAPYVLPTEVWDALWAHLTEADCECDDSTGHKCQACALVRKLESLKTMPLPAEAQPPEAEPSPKGRDLEAEMLSTMVEGEGGEYDTKMAKGEARPMKLEWGLNERQDAINILRQVCADHGDNDWPDSLHLGDVIEKHLWRNLEVEGDGKEGGG